MRIFNTDIGISFKVKQDKCCVFCDHCTNIFYDSHGPYMIDCEKSSKYADDHNCDGKCELFEESEVKNNDSI